MLKDMKLRWLIAAALLVTFFEVLSLSGFSLPPRLAIPTYSLIILGIGYEILWKGLVALKNLNFRSIKLLLVIAVVGAFYLGQYPEAAVVIVLFSLAEHLEDVGFAQSKAALKGLVDQMPKLVVMKDLEFPVDINTVKVGQIMLVKPFQMVPLDGQVVDGNSFVDESPITGESLPQEKTKGSKVFAGTLNRQGVLEVEITQLQQNSVFAKIREKTFEAMENKAKTQQFIEEFSRYYTPSIILLALFCMFVPWLFWGAPFQKGFAEALMLLVIACPCALVISTPISIFSAIGAASSKGIIIKGGRYLEAMGKVNWIAFDKTRTLTFGNPIVTDIIPLSGRSREQVLACAAALELFSEHPLAQSIVKAAKEGNIATHKVSAYESLVGKGAKATCHFCDNKQHYIGKIKGVEEEYAISSEASEWIDKLQGEGKTVIFLATGKIADGLIAIQDEIRPEAKSTVKELQDLKIRCGMLTGDHERAAKAVAQQVGIDVVKSECLPDHKMDFIRSLQQDGHIVGMVGDGVNDAPALALADVGVSMSHLGSDTAIETASVVILNEHLKAIPYLVKLGRKALSIIKFNTLFAILVKLCVIIPALNGVTNLALAIFADVGVTILVILNSLRLRY